MNAAEVTDGPRWGPVLQALRGSRHLELVARAGIIARGLFHLLLAALVLSLLFDEPAAWQANANGALTAVSDADSGELLLAVIAVAFAGLGLLRIVGALTDHRHGRLRRLSTAGSGALYVVLSVGTVAFLFGLRALGSEREQQRTAARVLDLPGGRWVLAGLGAVVLLFCLWQLVVTASGGFADTLHLEHADPPVRRLTLVTARIGIPARALGIAPLGVLFLVAAARDQPRQAKGLDGFLLDLAGTGWGRALVVLIAAGLTVFALYSFLEAWFRQVNAGA